MLSAHGGQVVEELRAESCEESEHWIYSVVVGRRFCLYPIIGDFWGNGLDCNISSVKLCYGLGGCEPTGQGRGDR